MIDFDVVGMKNPLKSVRGRTNARNANTFDKFRIVAVVVVVVFDVIAAAFRFERAFGETIAFKDIIDKI